MIEVFKTNIHTHTDATLVKEKIMLAYPSCLINFDLEDCDRILRIDGHGFLPEKVIDIVCSSGYFCEILN